MATPSMRSLEKAIKLLTHVAADNGEHSISALAVEIGLPVSTAHRIAATFERNGFMTRLRRGHYLAGPQLLRLGGAGQLSQVLTSLGRPIVEGLARKTHCAAHLGVFEGGMVTYLLKADRKNTGLFTREGTQLEAYCTGIGKVLLASLPDAALREYLANGPFIRLTSKTLTDKAALVAAITAVRADDYATDDAEMDTDLTCLAVPVRDNKGAILAAISISKREPHASASKLLVHLDVLRAAASQLVRRLDPSNPKRR